MWLSGARLLSSTFGLAEGDESSLLVLELDDDEDSLLVLGLAEGDELSLVLGLAEGDELSLVLGLAEGDELSLEVLEPDDVADWSLLELPLSVNDFSPASALPLSVDDVLSLALPPCVECCLPPPAAASPGAAPSAISENPATTT